LATHSDSKDAPARRDASDSLRPQQAAQAQAPRTSWRELFTTRHFLIWLITAAGISLLGFLLTFVLPEPNQQSLESIEKEGEQAAGE
jgi:hypothetical protein